MLDQLAAELKDRVHVLPCDLSDKDQVEALVPKAEEVMGKLDILVANAGVTKDNLFVQLRDEDWDSVININLTATFRLSRAAMKTMMRRRFGRIIGITSVVGVTGNPGQGNYTAAKAGMIGMMKSIAKEYARRGVTANCVAPGFIATAMTDKLNDKQREAILQMVPSGRLGTRRRHRRGRGLSRLRRGLLCHRPDPACEWRNGDDLIVQNRVRFRVVRACWPMVLKYGSPFQAGLGAAMGRGLDAKSATQYTPPSSRLGTAMGSDLGLAGLRGSSCLNRLHGRATTASIAPPIEPITESRGSNR